MNLFYSRGTCSLSPHIVLLEAGLAFVPVKVDIGTKKTADGGDYLAVNSKGSVPALQLDDGQVLTEGPAIVQYVADLKPESGLAPRAGTLARYRLMEMLNYISSEVHKGFSPLFNPQITPEWKEATLAALAKKFDWLSAHLAGRSFLLGDTFSVADAYLFTILGWIKPLKIELGKWPVLAAYHTSIGQRPKVREAMQAEGLLK
jgi:glutathione S-transferase